MNTERIQAFKDKIEGTEIFHLLVHARNYFSAEVATRAIAIVSIPIFTRLYTTAEAGVVAVFMSYFGIFSILIALNAHAAVGRYYYENTDDFPEFVGTTMTLVLGIIVVIAPFFYFFYSGISGLIDLPGTLPVFLFAACVFEIVYRIYMQILVPQKRSREAATITVLRGYSTFGVGVVLVFLLASERYRGQIWAVTAIGFVFSLYFVARIVRSARFGFNRGHLRYIATFAFPLIPYALSGVILNQFDRIMIDRSLGSSDAGLYSLGYSIGALIYLLIHAVQMAFTPYFFEMQDKKEYRKLDKTTRRVFSLITLVALGLVFFGGDLGRLIADAKFHEGLKVIPPVVLGYLFFAVYMVYGRFIGYEKKTYYSSILVITAGVVNIVLNAVFIPRYGYVAAAHTTLVSYLLLGVTTWLVARFVIEARETPTIVVGKPLLFAFACLGLYRLALAAGPALWLTIIVKIVVMLLFSLLVFAQDLAEVRRSFTRPA